MKTALITGTSGFIGGALAGVLRGRYRVSELNRQTPPLWDFRSPVPADLPREVDLVVHAAATDGRDAAEPDVECFEVNTQSTARLLAYAQRAGARQFVLLSTGSVYPLLKRSCSETDPLEPDGPYAASKAAAEMLALGYRASLAVLCLRLFFPYGPGQRGPRLIPRLIRTIRDGQPVPLNGDAGQPTINPVFIDDALAWVATLIEQRASGVFNLAGPEHVTIRELAGRIGEQLARSVEFTLHPEIGGDRLGDISRVCRTTGRIPQVNLETGLAAAIAAQP